MVSSHSSPLHSARGEALRAAAPEPRRGAAGEQEGHRRHGRGFSQSRGEAAAALCYAPRAAREQAAREGAADGAEGLRPPASGV